MKDDLHGHPALLKLVLIKGHNLDRPDPSLHLPHSSFHARLHLNRACRLFQLHRQHPNIHDVLRNVHLLPSFSSGYSALHPAKRHDKAARTSPPAGKAIVDIFNIIDILQGFAFMFQAMSRKSFGKRFINEEKDLGYSSSSQSRDSMTDKPAYVEGPQL